MRYRPLPCGAVRCRAVPCFAVLSLSNIPDDNSSKHTELARDSMSSSTLYSSVEPSFSIFFRWAFLLCCTGIQQQQYSTMYEYVAVEYQSRKHSKAQQSTAHHRACPNRIENRKRNEMKINRALIGPWHKRVPLRFFCCEKINDFQPTAKKKKQR